MQYILMPATMLWQPQDMVVMVERQNWSVGKIGKQCCELKTTNAWGGGGGGQEGGMPRVECGAGPAMHEGH